MSQHTSPTPSRRDDFEADTPSLPQGSCSYILLVPEIKGERCGCVNFTLKKSMPGATCECGHLACFHHKKPEPSFDQTEVNLLRHRVQQLEERLRSEDMRNSRLIARVSGLEGAVESKSEEMSQEIKKSYGNLNRAWHSVAELERRSQSVDRSLTVLDEHMRTLGSEVRRLDQRQHELDDADFVLEDRLALLEETTTRAIVGDGRSQQDSIADFSIATLRPVSQSRTPRRRRSSASILRTVTPDLILPRSQAQQLPLRKARPCAWAVHISLLPTASQPFPFEPQTTAYQRCLSRGLHQMVVINDSSAASFVSAVSKAFERILKGRKWILLQAKLCDADNLQGLPMLRRLDSSLVSETNYTLDFLRSHCGVVDKRGRIDSLYIAVHPDDTLSWYALKHAPVFLSGLEESWAYDPLLDSSDPFVSDDDVDDNARPSAGDLVSGVLPSLKRAASQISRAGSFGAAGTVSGGVASMLGMAAAAAAGRDVGGAGTSGGLTAVAADMPKPAKVARKPCLRAEGCEAPSIRVQTS